ncbi:MAG: hypothetical protein ACREJ9_06445 [Candidatus Rokuibacteriota bacterium]
MAIDPRGGLAWLALGVVLAAFAATGCAPSTPAAAQRGTAVVVFIDFSSSIPGDDRTAYRREIEGEILPTLGAGDRLMIAPIHDRTLTEFRPLVDANLPVKPQFNGWFDNVMKHNRETREIEARAVQVKDRIKTDVAHVFSKRFASLQTDIFSSLIIAQKVFHEERRRKVLVLMSDMIEDSPIYRFDRMTWNADTTEKILTDLDAKALIPKLPGVCVYVSGVSAKSADLAENIGRFWHAYFKRTGADMDPSRYAHVLLHWPPSSTCRSSA